MPKHPPPHERHVPSSAIAGFIDPGRIEALLAPWVPDPHARAFVVRCMLAEGPAHHRGANYVLLRLLGLALERVPAGAEPSGEPGSVEVPMRLPPHLARVGEAKSYPLALPLGPIERLAARGSRELDAMVDCLTDGPPQHALANVAMVTLIAELLARLEGGEPR
jgi:hypothetical protein